MNKDDVPWREYLSYDPVTGVFMWLKRPSNRTYVGARAGSIRPDGYRYISLANVPLLEHQLAWWFVYGEWLPRGVDIDHINRNRAENGIANLRRCSRSDNLKNSIPKRGRRFKGAYWTASVGRWSARFKIRGGKNQFLGYFETEEGAARAYDTEALKHHGEFARLNFPQEKAA